MIDMKAIIGKLNVTTWTDGEREISDAEVTVTILSASP
jgi:hypothetical protein